MNYLGEVRDLVAKAKAFEDLQTFLADARDGSAGAFMQPFAAILMRTGIEIFARHRAELANVSDAELAKALEEEP
jgi:hypothetical protein